MNITTYFVLFYLSMASWNGMEVGRSRFSIKTSCLGKAIKKSIQYFIGNGKPRRERIFAKVFLNHYSLITVMFHPILIVWVSSSSSSGCAWRLFWNYLISGNDNEILSQFFTLVAVLVTLFSVDQALFPLLHSKLFSLFARKYIFLPSTFIQIIHSYCLLFYFTLFLLLPFYLNLSLGWMM